MRIKIGDALAEAHKLLDQAGISAPRLTAEVLLCHALGIEMCYLYAHDDEELSELAWIHYGRYLHQRLKGEPTQYITQVQEFYGRPFRVSPDVLIPRPETEHLIEVALERTPRRGRAIDIGCGSGAIAVTWHLETGCTTAATDISLEAVQLARRNAATLSAGVEFAVCDLASAFAAARFDLVLSNPPYIPVPEAPNLQREVRDFEPALALFGGPTGVEIYQRLIADAARIVKPGGWLVMEIGYQAQDRIQAMLAASWVEVQVKQDLAGWPRVVSAQFRP